MNSGMQEKQVKSKKRVLDHGEVFTAEREVNAMLDLVKQETERIDSRFLEPACGSGNFLVHILERKLIVVENRYRKSQLEYERNAVLAVSSIYGIDILIDNVVECRKRLFDIFDKKYFNLYKLKTKENCRTAVHFILERNILWGDALTLTTLGYEPHPIIFSEWSYPFNNSLIKRRDYTFLDLIPNLHDTDQDLFSNHELISDLGEKAFIPKETKSFPPINFLRIFDEFKS